MKKQKLHSVHLRAVLVCALFGGIVRGDSEGANPVQKVLQLLSELQAKVTAEGKASGKNYAEFSEWCEDRSLELSQDIKTAKAEVENLKATIEKASDDVDSFGTKIEALSSAISMDEADLKAAALIREKEATDFQTIQQNLADSTSALERSIAILEREARGGASLVQWQGMQGLAQAFSAMVDAAALDSADAARLTAFVQGAAAARSSDAETDADAAMTAATDAALGAPNPAAYDSHSGGVIETLDSLLEKAEAHLEESRQTETASKQNYDLLKQSLEDRLKVSRKDMDGTKKELAVAGEEKATAEGDLLVTQKDLDADIKALQELHHTCMSKAADFEEETSSRREELKAMATAKKAITETTGDAAEQTYGLDQVSLLQVKRRRLGRGLGGGEADIRAVRIVKRLAWRDKTPALMQLSGRLDSLLRAGTLSGEDPFAKVRKLISDMLGRLSEEANAEMRHKAWCDSEMAHTQSKKEDKEDDIEKLSTQIDRMTAEAAKLSEEVAAMQKEIAELVKSQAEMDKIRQEQKALYEKSKPEMEQGIQGVQLALKILREYYAKPVKDRSTEMNAASGIIGFLEVIESDFSKGLSRLVAEEEAALTAYKEQTNDNDVARETKEQDVKYKTKNSKALDKASSELSSDREGTQTELDAVNEYFTSMKSQCLAKAEPYDERKKRREQEIEGLQEALQTLQGEAVLLQENSLQKRLLRGVKPHTSGA